MKVLVTGGNGMVGRALMQRLRADNVETLGSVRTNPQVGQLLVGDIDGNTDWRMALAGCDAVVHTAARVHQMRDRGSETEYFRVNTEGTLRLAEQAAGAGVKRFVFLSSIKAMGEDGSFRADDVCRPQDPYGSSKWEAEKELHKISLEAGLEVVVLRLPLVYGPGVGANFLRLMEMVAKEVPLPFGKVCNSRSLIGLTNLVDAIVTCINHPSAAGRTLLVSDGEDISTPDLIRAMAHSLGCKARLLPVPVGLMYAVATLLGKRAVADRLFGSLTVDSEPLRHELGWMPPLTLQQGLNETASWYVSRI